MINRARWTGVDAAWLAALVVLGVAAMWSIWVEVFRTGLGSEEDSHILMAVPVAVWMVWIRRGRLRSCPPARSYWGLLLIAIGVAMERVGVMTAVEVARHLGAILVLLGGVTAVVGPAVVMVFLPAVVSLLFLLPVPGRVRQEIAVPLQEISAMVSEFVLNLFGFGVERLGNILTINGEQVAVAEACNGMRMVSALAIISFAFVFSVPMRHPVRLLLLLASPLVALLVNIVRLIPTVLFYGYMQKPTADLFHDLSGWAVLGLALVLLWGMLSLMRWMEIPIDPYPVARRERA
ncbi:MAG: exosortase/archaeosortase family protein [Planctomycetota bacterium]|nr:MAG: exosortase/archaeosortase family protein [Planctomycetota bacterium]